MQEVKRLKRRERERRGKTKAPRLAAVCSLKAAAAFALGASA